LLKSSSKPHSIQIEREVLTLLKIALKMIVPTLGQF